ncbi:hypothetical protein KN506_19050, partial [Acinetobacter baumannii]|uniref:hypothetical protein n=1 Tax=Acinetobacter baumannii TaxID=470 RepID=UPI001C057144
FKIGKLIFIYLGIRKMFFYDTGQSGVVVPVVAGVSVAIVAVALIAFGIKMRADSRNLRLLSQKIRKLTAEEIDEFYNGSKGADVDGVPTPFHCLPFNTEYEVPWERLVIGQTCIFHRYSQIRLLVVLFCNIFQFSSDENAELGSGEFGIVKKGTLKGSVDQDTPYT